MGRDKKTRNSFCNLHEARVVQMCSHNLKQGHLGVDRYAPSIDNCCIDLLRTPFLALFALGELRHSYIVKGLDIFRKGFYVNIDVVLELSLYSLFVCCVSCVRCC